MGICVVICLGAVCSALHIIVEPIIIVLVIAIILVLGVAQCENTIIGFKYPLTLRKGLVQ